MHSNKLAKFCKFLGKYQLDTLIIKKEGSDKI